MIPTGSLPFYSCKIFTTGVEVLLSKSPIANLTGILLVGYGISHFLIFSTEKQDHKSPKAQ